MARGVNRLVAWQRRVLYGSGGALLLTGAIWLAVHYGRPDDALPSPLEPWLMRLHGLASFAALFVFGVFASGHVPQGWRFTDAREDAAQRRTGVALCVLAGTLILSAYLLYYFAPDSIRPSLGWLHSGLGATMAALLLFHRRGG
jgi:hypothetical protein